MVCSSIDEMSYTKRLLDWFEHDIKVLNLINADQVALYDAVEHYLLCARNPRLLERIVAIEEQKAKEGRGDQTDNEMQMIAPDLWVKYLQIRKDLQDVWKHMD